MASEDTIHTLLERGDLREVATLAIEEYGSEIITFLVALLHDETDAKDVFGQACEDLWRGLPGFEARSSIRTWFYVLARHAASRFRRAAHRRYERITTLSEVNEVAERVHTRTRPHLRTEVKDRLISIRASLSFDDHVLLVLRVDQKLSWNDIARVLSSDRFGSDEDLSRVTARLRKRFQLVKEELRERARRAGLLDADAHRSSPRF